MKPETKKKTLFKTTKPITFLCQNYIDINSYCPRNRVAAQILPDANSKQKSFCSETFLFEFLKQLQLHRCLRSSAMTSEQQPPASPPNGFSIKSLFGGTFGTSTAPTPIKTNSHYDYDRQDSLPELVGTPSGTYFISKAPLLLKPLNNR